MVACPVREEHTMTPTAALQAALTDLTGPTIGPDDPG
jgi:hypothetical protein